MVANKFFNNLKKGIFYSFILLSFSKIDLLAQNKFYFGVSSGLSFQNSIQTAIFNYNLPFFVLQKPGLNFGVQASLPVYKLLFVELALNADLSSLDVRSYGGVLPNHEFISYSSFLKLAGRFPASHNIQVKTAAGIGVFIFEEERYSFMKPDSREITPGSFYQLSTPRASIAAIFDLTVEKFFSRNFGVFLSTTYQASLIRNFKIEDIIPPTNVNFIQEERRFRFHFPAVSLGLITRF